MASTIACAASLSGKHGQVSAFTVDGIDELRRVADDDNSIRIERCQPVVAAFRNQMGGIFQRLAAGEQGGDGRMRLEAIEHVVDVDAGLNKILEQERRCRSI